MSALRYDINQIVDFLNSLGSQEVNLKHYDFIDPLFWVTLKALADGPKPGLTVKIDKNSSAYGYYLYLFERGRRKSPTVVPIRKVEERNSIENIVKEILQIANLRFCDYDDEFAFSYILMELINNSVDHGQSPAIACAQVFPNADEIEISVADHGLGFLQTIKKKYNDVSSYEEAIKRAIQKGITGYTITMYGSVTKHVGMGLYVISKMVREVVGDMIIVSGDAVFSLRDNLVRKIEIPWQGSIVSVRFNISRFERKILDYGFSFWLKLTLEEEEGEEDMF